MRRYSVLLLEVCADRFREKTLIAHCLKNPTKSRVRKPMKFGQTSKVAATWITKPVLLIGEEKSTNWPTRNRHGVSR